VLCLAAGGGQQSSAFALLGAEVTVLDISQEQLDKDVKTAAHYCVGIRVIQGDIRDLSPLLNRSFDLVWQAHSLNFVPDSLQVFQQVRLVIKKGGLYRLQITNPFVFGLWLEKWQRGGYPLNRPYGNGAFHRKDPNLYFDTADGKRARAEAPKEFSHTLGTIINGLVANSFRICGLWEDNTGNIKAKPGSWAHLKAIAPPWITLLCEYVPK
jgi:SAM-dependent methyltransferase